MKYVLCVICESAYSLLKAKSLKPILMLPKWMYPGVYICIMTTEMLSLCQEKNAVLMTQFYPFFPP